MPPQPPPRNASAKTEGRGREVETKHTHENFKSLAKRLIKVSKEEYEEQEKLYDEAKSSKEPS